jgi:hypothetical protein
MDMFCSGRVSYGMVGGLSLIVELSLYDRMRNLYRIATLVIHLGQFLLRGHVLHLHPSLQQNRRRPRHHIGHFDLHHSPITHLLFQRKVRRIFFLFGRSTARWETWAYSCL